MLLALETSTKACSVAVWHQGQLLAETSERGEHYQASESLHLFIQKTLAQAGCALSGIEAIAVSSGPGSFTGLRIGVSAAKGLAYSLNIPLISADSLEILVAGFLRQHQLAPDDLAVPVLDARRDEVYCAVHAPSGKRIHEVQALVLTGDSFSGRDSGTTHFMGDAAAKCRELLRPEGKAFHEGFYPRAQDLARIAERKWQKGEIEDVAYFEPFYLKNFHTKR